MEPKTHYFRGYGQAAGRLQLLVRSACLPAALARRQPGLWTKEEVCAALRKESHAACESCHGGHASLAVLTSSETCKVGGTHGLWVKDMGWSWFHQHLVSKVNSSGRVTYAELETDHELKCISGGLAAVTGGVMAKGQPSQGSPGVHITPAPAVPAPRSSWSGTASGLLLTSCAQQDSVQQLSGKDSRGVQANTAPLLTSQVHLHHGGGFSVRDTATFLLQTLHCHNVDVKLGEQ